MIWQGKESAVQSLELFESLGPSYSSSRIKKTIDLKETIERTLLN